jgi:hypothetical protein
MRLLILAAVLGANSCRILVAMRGGLHRIDIELTFSSDYLGVDDVQFLVRYGLVLETV